MGHKQFDITLKDLIEDDPTAWPLLLNTWTDHTVEVIDADISTLTAASDKVLKLVRGGTSWLLNLELQADHELGLPDRMQYASVALRKRHGLLVRNVVILLRRKALASDLTGELKIQFPRELPYEVFHYQIVKLWELPLELILTGGLGTLPLAPLTDGASHRLPYVIDRIDERVRAAVSSEQVDKLWSATFFLMGLRYKPEETEQLIARVINMSLESSSTYQWVLAKGHAKGLAEGQEEGQAVGQALGRLETTRNIILRQASIRFGTPSRSIQASLNEMDIDRLETLVVRLLNVSSWGELLAD